MPKRRPDGDAYWRLELLYPEVKHALRTRLLDRGFEPKKDVSRAELLEYCRRQCVCFLGYDDCTLGELEKFARDRGILGKSTLAYFKPELVKMLTLNDERPMFFKFIDLPAELRTRVYSFYLLSFGDKSLDCPCQPPLARTCQLLRKEVLPVFYKECRFRLVFDPHKWFEHKWFESKLSIPTTLWLFNLTPEHFDCLRKVDLDIQLTRGDRILKALVELEVNVGCEVSVFISHGRYRFNGKQGDKIKETLSRLMYPSSSGSLSMEKIHLIRRIVEKAAADK